MGATTHLKSLQALEMAVRAGSLKAAADRLAITPAAVGQRIRALEDYLGSDLLLRGRSGLKPTPELETAMIDLSLAFAALDRVTATLDFQRVAEIHLVVDTDLADLWLAPRLPAFREAHPNILFCINGAGDVPLRIGAPDVQLLYGGEQGAPLFTDALLPVCSDENLHRISDWDPVLEMEGMPLLHLARRGDGIDRPGWGEWFAAFGHRASGPERGVRYNDAKTALNAARQGVGFLLCGYAMVAADLREGTLFAPFALSEHLVAPYPYRLKTRADVQNRPQIQRFVSWLRAQAQITQHENAGLAQHGTAHG